MVYNYIADICGIILTLLILFLYFFNKSNAMYKSKYMMGLIFYNILLCTSSIWTALIHNDNIVSGLSVFANFIYCYMCIYILVYTILYVISLIPVYLKNIDKKEKKIKSIFGASEIILFFMAVFGYTQGFDINKLISYIKYWSYINIGLTIFICALILYFIDSKKIQTKIKQSTLIIFPFLLCGAIFQFTHTQVKFSGFLYSMLIIFFYVFYHSKQLDVISGGYLNASFEEDFNKLIRQKKTFHIITINMTNFDFLKKYTSEYNLNMQLSNAIRLIEQEYPRVVSYRESVNKLSFLVQGNELEEVKQKITNMVDIIINKTRNFEEVNDMLHYKIFIFECPDVLDNFSNLTKIRDSIYDKCEINNYYVVTKEDAKQINIQNDLIEIFNDIFTRCDPRDERVQVLYQPIFNIDDKNFTTMEALTRLKIRNKTILPNDFIKILEDNGMIHKYSLLVLSKICMFLNRLKEEDINIEGISINFSSEEFKMSTFESDILEIVNNYNIEPSLIRIELTESNDQASQSVIEEKMNNMRKYGFKFYLDDFGTGYSNITKLASLKFDMIKIDKSIVWDSLNNEDIRKLLIDLTTFIKAMDTEILFEGVESEEMSRITNNVKYLQGFLFSKPIAENEILEFLRENN